MMVLILCFPGTSTIPVMLQQGRAAQGPFSPALLPTSKPVQGNTPPGMGHSGGGTGCLNMQELPSHPKLPPVPGHVLAGERFDLKQRGRGQGGHLKPSGRLWAGRLVLACSWCPQNQASLGCFSAGATGVELVWEESWAAVRATAE